MVLNIRRVINDECVEVFVENGDDVHLVLEMHDDGETLLAVPVQQAAHLVDVRNRPVHDDGQSIRHWHVAFDAKILHDNGTK